MEIASIISIIAVCLTAITLLMTQGRRGGQMESDIKHVIKTVERIEASQNNIDDKLDNLTAKVVELEQSVKSAHRRIDGIESKKVKSE